MRYHIDTIPVWDAYKKDCECPLCELQSIQEQSYVESFLGASVMEPDVRIEVNEKGFCAKHFAQMLAMKNRLGLTLMTHTHLKQVLDEFQMPIPQRGGFLKRKKNQKAREGETCILCDRLRNTMNRYCYTALHLWRTDRAFRETFEKGKGHCQPHHAMLCSMAAQEMSAGDAQAFHAMISGLQKENLARIERELWWFTQKFDYRNADKPWKESKDAPERAILKLRGKHT